MSISSTTSSSGTTPADWQLAFKTVRNDFRTLAQAIQSGNLTDAQQAYATLQKDLPANSSSTQSGTNPRDTALAQIGQALQSGDITGAQQALSALQQGRHAHHHHHHQDADQSTSDPSATTNASGVTGASDSILNVTA